MLNYLSLEWADDVDGLRHILERLRAPHLRSLIVLQRYQDQSDSISLFSDIAAFIEASQADKLKYLSVETPSCHPPSDDLMNLLKLTPNLKEIRFFWPYTPDSRDAVITYLLDKADDFPHLLPRLRRSTVTLDDFMELFSSGFDTPAERFGNLDVLKAAISA